MNFQFRAQIYKFSPYLFLTNKEICLYYVHRPYKSLHSTGQLSLKYIIKIFFFLTIRIWKVQLLLDNNSGNNIVSVFCGNIIDQFCAAGFRVWNALQQHGKGSPECRWFCRFVSFEKNAIFNYINIKSIFNSQRNHNKFSLVGFLVGHERQTGYHRAVFACGLLLHICL